MKYHVPHASVVGQWNTGGNIFLLTLSCPEIAAETRPGQFAHLRCGNTLDPLLRRPLSIFRPKRKRIALLLLSGGWEMYSAIK